MRPERTTVRSPTCSKFQLLPSSKLETQHTHSNKRYAPDFQTPRGLGVRMMRAKQPKEPRHNALGLLRWKERDGGGGIPYPTKLQEGMIKQKQGTSGMQMCHFLGGCKNISPRPVCTLPDDPVGGRRGMWDCGRVLFGSRVTKRNFPLRFSRHF